MKVDELHAPAVTAAATTTPQRSLTDKIGEALVHTVEFLVPPLKRSLAWDSSEFDPMFPDWYMNTHPKQQATATSSTSTTAATIKTTGSASDPSTPDMSFGRQRVASSAA